MTENRKKFLGIIGGMGAEAGAALYQQIIKLTPVDVDQDHIETLVYSNTNIPDRTKGILKQGPSSYPLLREAAKLLDQNGVEIIILGCVTSHYFIEDLRKEVRCEILSAVEETIERIKQTTPDTRKVGVLATTGTIKTELFQSALRRAGLDPLVPPDNIQEKYVMEALYAPNGIKAGFQQPARDKMLLALNWLLLNGAEAVISGCSEFPLLFSQDDCLVPLIDAMDALIRTTILKCTGKKAMEKPH
ncbi:MAG: amino acid racemase [candidate division Zixibacteria bacterium]|nr:amino acid racemase [candidate division Zixibacteria bacterium]